MSKQNMSTLTGAKSADKSDFSLIDESFLKSRIYTIRGIKVMVDSDLAEIYGYTTKAFNRQVKNNIEKFEDDFRFQLTKEEYYEVLRCKKCTLESPDATNPQNTLRSKFLTLEQGKYSKFLPFAFTEQGIYMLMTVLKGERATAQSRALIRLFKQMKDYIVAENMQLLGAESNPHISSYMLQNTREIAEIRGELAETRTDVFAMKSDLQKVMENFIDPSTFKHFLILNGQKLEADVAYTQIYGMAKKSVVVIDNYVDVKTLDLLRSVAKNVSIAIFSDQYGKTQLTESMRFVLYLAERPSFYQYLEGQNLAVNTMDSYCWTADFFKSHFGRFGRKSLADYKSFLLENYKPKTVNLRIQGINKYLDFAGKSKLRIKNVKVQQKSFLENVISNADYKFLKTSLLQDGQTKWYFVVWFLSATGARVGELVKLKVEHVECGYFDIYGKGGKLRRLYIPETLQKEALRWLESEGRSSGYLFLNRFGKQITPRGIASQLKTFAKKYGLDEAVVYPHSFRHRFAKNFLEKRNDIALLADLMGHEHIETTRIYLRQTASEQREVVNKVVTW